MKVSPNFHRSEFTCHCGCGFASTDKILVEVLERTRSHFKKKYPDRKIHIIITSGNRCYLHNKNVGGSVSSFHIKGMAADFKVKNVHPDEVAEYLCNTYPNCFGIGRYDNRTHLDTRSHKARWDERTL